VARGRPARSAAPDPESDRNPAVQIVESDLTDAAAVQGVTGAEYVMEGEFMRSVCQSV